MAFIEDLSIKTYCPEVHESVPCFSIGWLGDCVPRTGIIAPRVLSLLRHYARYHSYDDGDLGCHACEICGRGSFHGEFWIEFFDRITNLQVRFVLPVGIFHYIDDHRYLPPQEFLDAVDPLARELESNVRNEI